MSDPTPIVTALADWPSDGSTYEERNFIVANTTTEAAARAAVLANTTECPASVTADNGVTLWRLPNLETRFDNGVRTVKVRYERASLAGEIVSLSMRATMSHITQSKGTAAKYPPGDGTPNFKGAIGVGEDGSVAGVEVPVPTCTFTVEKFYNASNITQTFLDALHDLQGKINGANVTVKAWGGDWVFAAGSLRYMGAEATGPSGNNNVRFLHSFEASRNQTGLTVGGIEGINKAGWQYLWVKYAKDIDANQLVAVPKYVYVENVHDTGDFSII